MRARWLGAWTLLLAVACVPAETRLRPDPEAHVLPTDREAATTEQQGVHLIADGDAWKGHPSNLERRLTPIYVRLENSSGRPLRLRYADFVLVGNTSRFHYTAMPPMSLRNQWSSPSSAPPREQGDSEEGGAPNNEGGAPDPEGYTPTIEGYTPTIEPAAAWRVNVGYGWGWGWGLSWGWGYPYSPWYSPYYGPYWGYPSYYYDEPLPTEDMLTRALPEGVLEPGGSLDGFIYFQGVIRREHEVTLEVRLVDARTNEPFGTLDIPFQVHQG